ncbi:MAG: phosphoribosylamine--glycine ligase [Vampirovibrionales bacterium]
MRILIIGSGGREHALAWRLSQDSTPHTLFFAPGNPGMASLGQCLDIQATDTHAIPLFAQKEAIDLVVIGPEAPLAAGLTDALLSHGLTVFGPTQQGARVEASKAFAKQLMAKAHVPTAAYQEFENPLDAIAALDALTPPYVIKEDGLAAGKGVTVTSDKPLAIEALHSAAAKGACVVLEAFLEGEEVSVLAICDGTRAIPMIPARDFKRAHEGNLGPNTGGMGSIAPVPDLPTDFLHRVNTDVLAPMMQAFTQQGIHYRGVLYAGLMVHPNGSVNVVEFNARFGDPETQVVLALLDEDLAPILLAAAQGNLSPWAKTGFSWKPHHACCVVVASGGYPNAPQTGDPITLTLEPPHSGVLFHAGTTLTPNHGLVTSGGRVFGAVGTGTSADDARHEAYALAKSVIFNGAWYRTDIGAGVTQPTLSPV